MMIVTGFGYIPYFQTTTQIYIHTHSVIYIYIKKSIPSCKIAKGDSFLSYIIFVYRFVSRYPQILLETSALPLNCSPNFWIVPTE